MGLLASFVMGCGTTPDSPGPDGGVVAPVPDGGASPSFVPSAIAPPVIPSFEAVVTKFGAIPDDGMDDTAAIQAGLDAVDAAGGGILVFPPGRFDISIDPVKRRALTLHARLRLAGKPEGAATVRLADKQIGYESIMAAETYPTRLDDLELVGLTFDANSENNPVVSADETNGEFGNPTFRYVLRSFVGDRARVQNCTFVNLENGNTISFNGDDVHDIVIEKSRFLSVGGLMVDHDHSTLYTYAYRVRISDNEFQGRNGAGTLGARTAIETHADDVEVRGNIIKGYLQGGKHRRPDRGPVQANLCG